ncbi:MAG: hypothetical protein ACO1TE_18755 [Prosthecobacter sp.]
MLIKTGTICALLLLFSTWSIATAQQPKPKAKAQSETTVAKPEPGMAELQGLLGFAPDQMQVKGWTADFSNNSTRMINLEAVGGRGAVRALARWLQTCELVKLDPARARGLASGQALSFLLSRGKQSMRVSLLSLAILAVEDGTDEKIFTLKPRKEDDLFLQKLTDSLLRRGADAKIWEKVEIKHDMTAE